MDDLNDTTVNLIAKARAQRDMLGLLLEHFRSFLLMQAETAISPRLRTRVDPEDVVQHTLAEAAAAFDQFSGTTEPEFSAWLQRMHRNNLNDVMRRLLSQKRAIHREQQLYESDGSASFFWNEPAADQSTPSQRVIRGEKALRLAHLLQELPPAQRDAVRMRHLEGRPVQEIADELDRSIVAVAGLIKRGLQALRSKMHDESWM